MFTIYFDGEAEALIAELSEKALADELNRDEKDLYRGVRIWESYLENKNAGARRMFWIYGPETKEITIVGLEKHPEPGRGFGRVRLATKAMKKAVENRKKPKK